jgi:hypothetical protein
MIPTVHGPATYHATPYLCLLVMLLEAQAPKLFSYHHFLLRRTSRVKFRTAARTSTSLLDQPDLLESWIMVTKMFPMGIMMSSRSGKECTFGYTWFHSSWTTTIIDAPRGLKNCNTCYSCYCRRVEECRATNP